jgi:hypothetical protein
VSSTHFPALVLVAPFVAGFAVSGIACCCPVLSVCVNILVDFKPFCAWLLVIEATSKMWLVFDATLKQKYKN